MSPRLAARMRFRAAALAVLVLCSAAQARAQGVDTDTDSTRRRTVRIGSSSLEIAIQPGRLALDDSTLSGLISDSARAIASYYGQLPFSRARVLISPSQHAGIHGSTHCFGTGTVRLRVGAGASAADFRSDWVVTHELLHAAFPWVGKGESDYDWVGEGLSSYVEPLVRVRAGTLSETEFWRDLLRGAPRGLPGPGDRGLDRTHTWGRTYWGGLLFWLEVDLTIRERTQDEKSIRDALRAVVRTGADVCDDWSMQKVIATGDAATGTQALSDVYARRGRSNQPPDLAGWQRKLGVALSGERVLFDDRAPWAARRKKLTRD